MPGLSLTEAQTRRLLGLPRNLCEAALKGLAGTASSSKPRTERSYVKTSRRRHRVS